MSGLLETYVRGIVDKSGQVRYYGAALFEHSTFRHAAPLLTRVAARLLFKENMRRYLITRLDIASAVFVGVLCAAIVLIPDGYDWHLASGLICFTIPFCAIANQARCKREAKAQEQGQRTGRQNYRERVASFLASQDTSAAD